MPNLKLGLILLIASLYIASAAYDPNKALTCAYASALTHCKPANVEAWNCGAACKNLTGFQNYFSTVVPVTVDQSVAFNMIFNPSTKTFIITFRGSIGAVQVIMEFLEPGGVPYNLSSVPGALIDDYFYNHYVKYLRDLVLSHLKTAVQAYPDYEFIFTGHSLGAAFATLTAYDSIISNITTKDQSIIYNFGSPRVGNYIFAQAVQGAVKEIYRVTHWRDPVPHVPPCITDKSGLCVKNKTKSMDTEGSIIWPAYHLSQEVFYNEASTNYTLCNTDGEDPNCIDQFKTIDWKIPNHLHYMNVHMDCDPSPSAFNGHFLKKRLVQNF